MPLRSTPSGSTPPSTAALSAARLLRPFTAHPASLGETYKQHMRASLGYAWPLLGAALAAFAHAALPFLFTATASTTVKRLHARMSRRCVACPSGPRHRPDLFVRREPAEPAFAYEI